jgi:hypothetical protein
MDDGGADRIEAAVGRVERAIKDKWSTFHWLGIIVLRRVPLVLAGDSLAREVALRRSLRHSLISALRSR